MANTLVQLRVDEASRLRAAAICQQLGFDLPAYLRICIVRLIQENGVPFSMKLDASKTLKALEAMQKASQIAKANGISDMSLEEINAEIAATRRTHTP